MIAVWIIIGVLTAGALSYAFFIKSRAPASNKDEVGLQLILAELHELPRAVDNKPGEWHQQVPESVNCHSSGANPPPPERAHRLPRLPQPARFPPADGQHPLEGETG